MMAAYKRRQRRRLADQNEQPTAPAAVEGLDENGRLLPGYRYVKGGKIVPVKG